MILEYQKLGDVADFIRGITYKPNDLIENFSEGSTVCMRTANVQVQLKQDDLLSVPVSLVKNKDKFLIEGDILVSTANSWNLVGKCCWIPKLDYSATAGGFISILRANQEKLDQRYLYHWFNSPNTQLLARNCGRQTTNISNMDLDRCLSMKIPIPPLPEQRRIASILDKADELRQKRQQAIEKLDQLLQATFIDMFGDPVSNPKGWDKVEVGKVTTCIVPGRDKPKSFTGTTPWITTDDLNSLGYTSQSKKQMGLTQAEIDDVRAKVIPCRSVVMSCVGNLGITSIANNEFVMNQQLHSYQCFEQITPEFLMFCLPFEKNYMFSRATSTTLPYMNKSVCNSVPVILPPMDLQEKWSKILLSIEYQKQKLYKQLDIQNQLFSSLQNQAFSGTL